MSDDFFDFVKKYNNYKTPVSLFTVKYIYQNLALPFVYFFIRIKCPPNIVTMLSFISFIIGAGFFINENYTIAGVFWLLNYVLDCADGALARATNQGSRFGAFFDVLVDRVISVLFLALLIVSVDIEKESGIAVILGSIGIVSYSLISSMRPHYFPELKGYANKKTKILRIAKLPYELLDTGNLFLLTLFAFSFGFEGFLFSFYAAFSLCMILITLSIVYKIK